MTPDDFAKLQASFDALAHDLDELGELLGRAAAQIDTLVARAIVLEHELVRMEATRPPLASTLASPQPISTEHAQKSESRPAPRFVWSVVQSASPWLRRDH
jgi:hypothetical protein